MKIGFIGLGVMGRPMARNLLKAGHELVVYTHNPETLREFAALEGVTAANNAKEVAEQTKVIFTMVQNAPQVHQAVSGSEGILAGLQPGSILVDTSSIDPTESRAICAEIEAAGGEMVDAPVSGGEPKAVDGTLAFMCGGKPEVFARVKELLSCMGSTVTYCGTIGAGNTTKLANQIIVACNIAACAEALTLGKKLGVEPEIIYRAIRGGLAGSTVMDAKVPMMLEHSFKPGFRMDLHLKDLNNVAAAAGTVDMELPLTDHALHILRTLVEQGKGGNDHSGMLEYYEGIS